MVANIVLILGDQLSPGMSSLRAAGRDDSVVVMAEVMAEARYVRHHRKKIAFLFAAMRHLAAELVADGWRVDYVTIDDPANSGTLAGEVDRARRRHKVERVI
ncbi:cryptochrome/photolyase family protein, partial [Leclercia adecarboxylata]|uniref:cryptochrome/photolyase family protein n=1 Tax=Leclercia adecarboxylata TaxID=83655 RepID=UPI00234C2CF2